MIRKFGAWKSRFSYYIAQLYAKKYERKGPIIVLTFRPSPVIIIQNKLICQCLKFALRCWVERMISENLKCINAYRIILGTRGQDKRLSSSLHEKNLAGLAAAAVKSCGLMLLPLMYLLLVLKYNTLSLWSTRMAIFRTS